MLAKGLFVKFNAAAASLRGFSRAMQISSTLGAALLAWVLFVRALRWRKYNAIHKRFKSKYDDGKGSITPQEAQEIMHVSSGYDMPLLLNYALAFALFKTYGIPSISKILASTQQLKSKETIAKRYADTEILISTWVACPISGFLDAEFAKKNMALGADAKPADDPRAMIALARVNWQHARYNITNDDYLYTLCLFVIEPAVWAAKFGWRELSDLEKHAYFVFWADIGRKMGIQDIPESFEDMQSWSQRYEREYMVPADTNQEVAQYTLDELLFVVPNVIGLKSLGQRIAICLMEDVVRNSMMQPKQPRALANAVLASVRGFSYFERYFLLPRSNPKFSVEVRPPSLVQDNTCPRLYPTKWASKPWYKPESTGLGYVRDKLLVGLGWYAEMPGPHLRSDGYRLDEMGPVKLEKLGREEVFRQAAEMQGCPIAAAWSS